MLITHTRVAEITEEAEAKASTEEGFMQYLIESNCEGWYAGDPNGDLGMVQLLLIT